jgi:hypothetical protein
LTDLPLHVHWIYLAVRHSLSFGCSGYYLREYLLEIKNWNEELFRKIKIYVSGFILNGKDVVPNPHVILASDLFHYLERYPIELCTTENFSGLDPINDFISSMFKEFLKKDFLPRVGSRTCSTPHVLGEEDVEDETIGSLEEEVKVIFANLPEETISASNPVPPFLSTPLLILFEEVLSTVEMIPAPVPLTPQEVSLSETLSGERFRSILGNFTEEEEQNLFLIVEEEEDHHEENCSL